MSSSTNARRWRDRCAGRRRRRRPERREARGHGPDDAHRRRHDRRAAPAPGVVRGPAGAGRDDEAGPGGSDDRGDARPREHRPLLPTSLGVRVPLATEGQARGRRDRRSHGRGPPGRLAHAPALEDDHPRRTVRHRRRHGRPARAGREYRGEGRRAAFDKSLLGAFAVQVEEGELDHRSRDAATAPFDGPLHVHAGAQRLMRWRHRRERDRLFEDRAPADARRATDLATAHEDRTGRPIHDRRDRRRQALGAEQALDVVPVELQADEPSTRAAVPLLALESEPADEVGLVEADEPPEADLARAVVLVGVHRVAGGRVVDLEQDESSLEPDDIEREHPGRPDPVAAACVHQQFPERDRVLRRDPELIPEIAGVAGSRDVDRHLLPAGLERCGPAPEVAQVAERAAGRRLQHVPRQGTLDGERGHLFRHVIDRHVEAGRVLAEPAELGVGGGPAERAVVEVMNRPVVDDLAVFVAPRRVVDLARLQFRRVAGDDPIDESERVGTRDFVLVERADVDERRGLADRVVLDVVSIGIDRRRVIAAPLPPLLLARRINT